MYNTGTKGAYTMSNVAKVLRDEISRISRRETKTFIEGIGRSHKGLKKIVADLKNRVVLLENDNKRLLRSKVMH